MAESDNDRMLRVVEKYLGMIGRAIGWLYLLIVAVALSNLVGVFLFDYLGQGVAAGIVWIIIVVLGIITGVFWAEHVRKEIGFYNLFIKLRSSSDLDDSQKNQKLP